ncbi:MAG: sensor histidine kinase [Verrucomicrobiales bacterium]
MLELMELQNASNQLVDGVSDGAVDPDQVAGVKQLQKDVDLEYLSEELPLAFDQSIDGVKRVATIVRAMKDFANPVSKERASANLNEAIRTTLTITQNEWRKVASLNVDLAEDLPSITCVVSEINQVVLNLIINARDAVEDRHGKGSDQGRIGVATTYGADFVTIRISDNGCGIPTEIHERIFDPFFTTKEVGRGSGQGLAVAHGVITQQHGGSLCFETAVDEETTFIIELPIR